MCVYVCICVCVTERKWETIPLTAISYSLFISFILWHINLWWLFNAKGILVGGQQWYYLTHSWEDKRVHTFRKSISPKVNVIEWLKFELAYYDVTVQYAMETFSLSVDAKVTILNAEHILNKKNDK